MYSVAVRFGSVCLLWFPPSLSTGRLGYPAEITSFWYFWWPLSALCVQLWWGEKYPNMSRVISVRKIPYLSSAPPPSFLPLASSSHNTPWVMQHTAPIPPSLLPFSLTSESCHVPHGMNDGHLSQSLSRTYRCYSVMEIVVFMNIFWFISVNMYFTPVIPQPHQQFGHFNGNNSPPNHCYPHVVMTALHWSIYLPILTWSSLLSLVANSPDSIFLRVLGFVTYCYWKL